MCGTTRQCSPIFSSFLLGLSLHFTCLQTSDPSQNPPQGTRAFRRAGPGGTPGVPHFAVFFGAFFWIPKMTPKVPKMSSKGLPNGAQNPPKIVTSGLRDPSPWPLRFWTPFWIGLGRADVLQMQQIICPTHISHFSKYIFDSLLASILEPFGHLFRYFGVPEASPK